MPVDAGIIYWPLILLATLQQYFAYRHFALMIGGIKVLK